MHELSACWLLCSTYQPVFFLQDIIFIKVLNFFYDDNNNKKIIWKGWEIPLKLVLLILSLKTQG